MRNHVPAKGRVVWNTQHSLWASHGCRTLEVKAVVFTWLDIHKIQYSFVERGGAHGAYHSLRTLLVDRGWTHISLMVK